MNTGAISTRYAKALLLYSEESGRSAQVFAQVYAMLQNPDLAQSPLEPELEKFIGLLISKGREEFVRPVFRSFVSLYCKQNDIVLAKFVCVENSAELTARMQSLLEKQTGCKVIMETTVDPSLIGGFILEVDHLRLNASVRHQIETIRREFVIANNRIV